jgi:hypothetical protein
MHVGVVLMKRRSIDARALGDVGDRNLRQVALSDALPQRSLESGTRTPCAGIPRWRGHFSMVASPTVVGDTPST